jgi:hypothetical protein
VRAEVGTAVSATVVVEVGVVVGEGDMGRIDAPAGDSKCFVKAAAATAVRELGGSIILVEIRVGEIVEDLWWIRHLLAPPRPSSFFCG